MTEINQLQLSDQIKAEIDTWIAKYPADQRRSAIIPALHIVQQHHGGSLSNELIEATAAYIDIPAISAYEVASFYSMYEVNKNVGKHKICVCTNISCMLCGSEQIVDHLKKRLGIGFGETTPDGKFTLKEVECLGACVNAPMLEMDKVYHEKLTPEKVDQLLDGVE